MNTETRKDIKMSDSVCFFPAEVKGLYCEWLKSWPPWIQLSFGESGCWVPLALDHLGSCWRAEAHQMASYTLRSLWLSGLERPDRGLQASAQTSTSSSISFRSWPLRMKASPSRTSPCFYKDRLGLYPHFQDGVAVNGGLPQIASLTHHREKMPEGIAKYIRDASAQGLAVIDWEEWRPIWIRNWDTKGIYKSQSQLLVAQKNPGWTPTQITKVAQQEFEISSRIFMLETLRLAKSLRPNQLWGFYLFPDCYNHDYLRSLENYTGRCPGCGGGQERPAEVAVDWKHGSVSIHIHEVRVAFDILRSPVRPKPGERGNEIGIGGERIGTSCFCLQPPYVWQWAELLTEVGL